MNAEANRIIPETDAAPAPPKEFARLAQEASAGNAPVTLNLEDGRVVVLERPKGSIIARVIRISAGLVEDMKLGSQSQLVALDSMKPYVEALLHVKVLGENPVIPIMNADQYQTLANNLGDAGVMSVVMAVHKNWGGDSETDAPLIKK